MNPVKLNIRKINNKDIKEIVLIHKECVTKTNSKRYSPEIIDEWLKQINEKNVLDQLETTQWLVLEADSNVLGFCQYDLNEGELYQIQIHPKFQGKGYGKRLYTFVEEDFKVNKKHLISLYATLNAVPFYESLGFSVIKEILFDLGAQKMKMMEMSKDLGV
jgi:ribosomal protein S18 acetylase RimI-like enzyme